MRAFIVDYFWKKSTSQGSFGYEINDYYHLQRENSFFVSMTVSYLTKQKLEFGF